VAAAVASGVLASAREAKVSVIHIQHLADDERATFFVPGTFGAEINLLVTPIAGEPVIIKHEPNSFLNTTLKETLDAAEIDSLVVVGMMSSMCVDATVRAAMDFGYPVTVVHDACAAPDFEFEDTNIPAHLVHAAFMRAVSDAGATVIPASALAF
jgi:nicotinamidase-related amidase